MFSNFLIFGVVWQENLPVSVMVTPPRSFNPVTVQFPLTHTSSYEFGLASATGLSIVTSSPTKLSQKSMPYRSGCRVGLATETRLWLFGTAKTSPLVSKLENSSVGGARPEPLPTSTGSTALPLETTATLRGDDSSVRNR